MMRRLGEWLRWGAWATRFALAPAPGAVCVSYFVYGHYLVGADGTGVAIPGYRPEGPFEFAAVAHASALLWAGLAFLAWPVVSGISKARGDAAETILLLGAAATLLSWSFDLGGFLVEYRD